MNELKYGYVNMKNEQIEMNSTEFIKTATNEVTNQGAKIGVVWASIGVSSWSDAAALLAFILSALALTEYIWKKIVRPSMVSMGYAKPIRRRVKLVQMDEDE